LQTFPHLKVDVRNPERVVLLEIRETNAYVSCGRIVGAGGMPTGTGGKATLLLSGGIDSPAAGYMLAKRGMKLDAAHFFSHPYTGERAKEKVLALAKIVGAWCAGIDVHIVPFTEIQLAIRQNCPENQLTIIMRRFMMKIAERIALARGSQALVTGESLGQVASQTVSALAVTNAACDLPVFRPLIGMDKEEIVTVSRKIGAYETSILPYEDCCTIFTPKHPQIKPQLEKILHSESLLDCETLIREAVENTVTVKPHDL
jgi:thiamine biosynthesis protein ThiI